MGWTDERIATLKKLWLDGLSASQIAKRLGGVTRCAVIGKVHRLGLSGRAAPSQPTRPALPKPKPAVKMIPAPINLPVAIAAPPLPKPELILVSESQITYLETRGIATVMTLGAHMCKWPIGDPGSDEFTLCGKKFGERGSYCHTHARRAHQPQQARKKTVVQDYRSIQHYL